jgi:hypothetical protein
MHEAFHSLSPVVSGIGSMCRGLSLLAVAGPVKGVYQERTISIEGRHCPKRGLTIVLKIDPNV